MISRSSQFIAATMICVAALQPSVTAADVKNYPASECVQWSVGGSPTYFFSAIGNNSTTDSLYVDCPIVKDGGDSLNATVSVEDRHPSIGVQCTLINAYVTTSDALIYIDSRTDTSVGSNPNHYSLIYPIVSSTLESYKYFSCRIPPKSNGNVSYIVTYSVNES